MGETRTITATEFKAKCLDILNRVQAREWEEVNITKRGKVVGVLRGPTRPRLNAWDDLHGCMKGTVTIPPDFDLTAPIMQELNVDDLIALLNTTPSDE